MYMQVMLTSYKSKSEESCDITNPTKKANNNKKQHTKITPTTLQTAREQERTTTKDKPTRNMCDQQKNVNNFSK